MRLTYFSVSFPASPELVSETRNMLENNAFILNGALDATFAVRPIPELAPDEVLVEVKKTGICGSDLHFYAEGRLEDNIVTHPFVSPLLAPLPAVPNAECGADVKDIRPGDRVGIEPASKCRVCADCKSGKYQLCEYTILASKHPIDGTLQRYYKLPEDYAYKLPDHLSLEDGAMVRNFPRGYALYIWLKSYGKKNYFLNKLEPLSVAVHAVSFQGQLRAGQNVVVFGAGPIGLLCMAVARALGAMQVIATDIVPARLKFASRYAATAIFLPPARQQGERKMEYSKRAAETMKNAFELKDQGSRSIDLVLDATGAETCIQMGFLVAKSGGRFVQVGFGAPQVQIPITMLQVKELIVKGSLCYGPGDYPLALGLASSGKINLKPLVTHRFKFEDAILAFETIRAGRSVGETGKTKNVIKTIISGPDVDPSAL
ncbi:xylitol dehydrogenase [Sanghuangporus baumii]|uniref:Xylitol dehydrogenase n=1 Tax=Sanghuangporus baumii TaxID=108892 RepID=A0A9Q5HU16_SANBA|nr:xylitol dehydrogenase [Sanghuangporus baumii]